MSTRTAYVNNPLRWASKHELGPHSLRSLSIRVMADTKDVLKRIVFARRAIRLYFLCD